MEIRQLKHQQDLRNRPRLKQNHMQFEKFIEELNARKLPDQTVEIIDKHIEDLNASLLSGNAFNRLLIKKRKRIIKLLENKHKLVPKHYYRNRWMVVGICTFGIPIGVAFGASMGNMGFMTTGLPFGMVLGLAIGLGLDKKALKQGRQLNIELKNEL